MHADTDALRAHGAATVDLGGRIGESAVTISHLVTADVAAALGPVGSRFAAALADAAEALTQTVHALGRQLTAGGQSTLHAAGAFDDADHRARGRIGP